MRNTTKPKILLQKYTISFDIRREDLFQSRLIGRTLEKVATFNAVQITIDPHTLERLEERGTSEEEIEDIVLNGTPEPAKGNRKAKSKVFDFRKQRAGKFYEQKKVKVVLLKKGMKLLP